MGRAIMTDATGVTGPTVRQTKAGLVAANLAGAAVAGALVAIGAFLFAKGGPGLGIPGGLLATAAAPVALAFGLAAISWKRSWRLARVVQSLPFLVVLGWAALLFLSPVQQHGRDDAPVGYSAADCPSCASWNAPAPPARLFANTYYVGTQGLSALLLTGEAGHILLDAGLPESAAPIMASVRALGFRVEDIRLIVNSHAHYDHAGGVAAIEQASGARVAASPSSARVLAKGLPGPDDPQFAIALPYPPVRGLPIRELADGDTLRVGTLVLTVHFTPGHTPGGTSWSWRACEGSECRDFVYADSQTPVSAEGFLFTRSESYPGALADFERGFAVLERLPCDVLVTPHPGASQLWERLAAGTLRDPGACRRYAAAARRQLARRVAAEQERR
jgi:metallo-beta-lactamase class B